MTHEAFGDDRHGLRAKLADIGDGARDMSHAGLKEAMAWTAYQWTVLALLTAIFVLVALSYGGIRTELAALKQERAGPGLDQTNTNAEIGKQMSDLKAGVMQTLSELEGSIAKIGAKLDARSAPPKPAAPAPKPAAKPKPQ
jgi:hypothetical protein